VSERERTPERIIGGAAIGKTGRGKHIETRRDEMGREKGEG
jgi:hypothetical protein